MNTSELITLFRNNHLELADYVNALPEDQFLHSKNGKWTAGQQLSHVYLCLLPISKALPSKEFLIQKFGKIERPLWDYDTVLANYKEALAKGGKAPEKFLPEAVQPEAKAELTAELRQILDSIQQQLADYTEEELDTIVMPHPLLGIMTVREMFFLMAYHAIHHLRQTEQNLA
ncbi:DinB family protein [Flavobacterium microcysteis]